MPHRSSECRHSDTLLDREYSECGPCRCYRPSASSRSKRHVLFPTIQPSVVIGIRVVCRLPLTNAPHLDESMPGRVLLDNTHNHLLLVFVHLERTHTKKHNTHTRNMKWTREMNMTRCYFRKTFHIIVLHAYRLCLCSEKKGAHIIRVRRLY